MLHAKWLPFAALAALASCSLTNSLDDLDSGQIVAAGTGGVANDGVGGSAPQAGAAGGLPSAQGGVGGSFAGHAGHDATDGAGKGGGGAGAGHDGAGGTAGFGGSSSGTGGAGVGGAGGTASDGAAGSNGGAAGGVTNPCGNGVVDAGEQCDDPGSSLCTNHCTIACPTANGVDPDSGHCFQSFDVSAYDYSACDLDGNGNPGAPQESSFYEARCMCQKWGNGRADLAVLNTEGKLAAARRISTATVWLGAKTFPAPDPDTTCDTQCNQENGSTSVGSSLWVTNERLTCTVGTMLPDSAPWFVGPSFREPYCGGAGQTCLTFEFDQGQQFFIHFCQSADFSPQYQPLGYVCEYPLVNTQPLYF